jgi:predicted TIM-barrel fold metal-dependent hydrolase
MYPIYKKAEELKIPVIFHTGSSLIPGTRMKYADPMHLDDLAVDFPDLTIVMAHAGRGFWHDQAFFLSRIHKNVFMDITGLPPHKLLKYFPELEKNAHKVLFGTDWPAAPKEISRIIQAICDLPLKEASIENILYNNAAGVLFG